MTSEMKKHESTERDHPVNKSKRSFASEHAMASASNTMPSTTTSSLSLVQPTMYDEMADVPGVLSIGVPDSSKKRKRSDEDNCDDNDGDDVNDEAVDQLNVIGSRSKLIPIEDRRVAKRGIQDETLLRISVNRDGDDQVRELVYRRKLHHLIDWNDQNDITHINTWRSSVWSRAGMKIKRMIPWMEEESCFIELYFNILLAKALDKSLILPTEKDILEDFNNLFAGQVLQDEDGNDMEPCEARNLKSLHSKISRSASVTKDRLYVVLKSYRRTELREKYRPNITMEMVHQYQQFKAELEAAYTTPDELYVEDRNSWKAFLLHLVTESSNSGRVAKSTAAESSNDPEASIPTVLKHSGWTPINAELMGSTLGDDITPRVRGDAEAEPVGHSPAGLKVGSVAKPEPFSPHDQVDDVSMGIEEPNEVINSEGTINEDLEMRDTIIEETAKPGKHKEDQMEDLHGSGRTSRNGHVNGPFLRLL